VLAVQGDVGEEFYLLCEGSAVVDRDGNEIAKLTEGGFFGEMALLDGEPRSASVRVTEDSRLLAIHRRDFSHLLDRIPEIARGMLTELTRRLREADRRLVS
jgi:CRP/FNR family transcriptional regulator/CRP/FNR family cyclic AMP-dependent transcriptional regulator